MNNRTYPADVMTKAIDDLKFLIKFNKREDKLNYLLYDIDIPKDNILRRVVTNC